MWIIPHLRNVPPASLGSSRFILHTINLLFCWTKPCETYYHVYFVYFCLSGPQSWALALFDSLTRVILLQRFWVLWTLDVQEIHMKLSAPKVKNTLQVMRRRRRDIMQGGGHLVQLWWVCSHRRLRSTDADTKLQRGSLSATVHTPACTKAHTHTHTPDGSETDFQHLHWSKEVLPRGVWSSRPAAQQPTHSWVIWRQSVSKPQRAEWKTDLKFRRDQLDWIRALHPWRTRSTFQESIWDAAKRIKHRKDRNARFNHGKHRAARMLWQITPSVQQQERRTLHPVTPWKQEDLLTWFPDVEKLEATERSIHAGWNPSCGFLISKQVSGGHPVEGLLMVVFVSARVGSYLRSEFGLAFSDFFHFNYV